MRRSRARFSELEKSVHTRSLAVFITTMSGFRFSVHTAAGVLTAPPGNPLAAPAADEFADESRKNSHGGALQSRWFIGLPCRSEVDGRKLVPKGVMA